MMVEEQKPDLSSEALLGPTYWVVWSCPPGTQPLALLTFLEPGTQRIATHGCCLLSLGHTINTMATLEGTSSFRFRAVHSVCLCCPCSEQACHDTAHLPFTM